MIGPTKLHGIMSLNTFILIFISARPLDFNFYVTFIIVSNLFTKEFISDLYENKLFNRVRNSIVSQAIIQNQYLFQISK